MPHSTEEDKKPQSPHQSDCDIKFLLATKYGDWLDPEWKGKTL